jgi:hypothetical protein
MIIYMSEQIERTVTFGRPVNVERSSYHLVRFVIKPPISVHNPKFLQTAVEATPGNTYAFGVFDLTHGVDVNFSDDTGTHGSVKVHVGVEPEVFQEVITTAFRSELEQENSTLRFSFPEDQ